MAHVQLTNADIAEFQALWKKETGKDITKEEEAAYAERMIRLVAIAYGVDLFPSPSE